MALFVLCMQESHVQSPAATPSLAWTSPPEIAAPLPAGIAGMDLNTLSQLTCSVELSGTSDQTTHYYSIDWIDVYNLNSYGGRDRGWGGGADLLQMKGFAQPLF